MDVRCFLPDDDDPAPVEEAEAGLWRGIVFALPLAIAFWLGVTLLLIPAWIDMVEAEGEEAMRGGVIPHHRQKAYDEGYQAGRSNGLASLEARVRAAHQRGVTDAIIVGGVVLTLLVGLWLALSWLWP